MKFYCFLFTLLLNPFSHAQSPQCTKNNDDFAFKALNQALLSLEDKSIALAAICNDLNPDDEYLNQYRLQTKEYKVLGTIINPAQIGNAIQNAIDLGPLGRLTELIQNGRTDAQRRYYRSLKEISLIKNPQLRIQRVYELVLGSQTSPQKDPQTNSDLIEKPMFENHQAIIDHQIPANPRSSSELLRYSLQLVQQNPVSPTQIDFEVNIIRFKARPWVRVQLMGAGRGEFDLDAFSYRWKFTPLAVRKNDQTVKSLKSKYKRCLQVQDCFDKFNVQSELGSQSGAFSQPENRSYLQDTMNKAVGITKSACKK